MGRVVADGDPRVASNRRNMANFAPQVKYPRVRGKDKVLNCNNASATGGWVVISPWDEVRRKGNKRTIDFKRYHSGGIGMLFNKGMIVFTVPDEHETTKTYLYANVSKSQMSSYVNIIALTIFSVLSRSA